MFISYLYWLSYQCIRNKYNEVYVVSLASENVSVDAQFTTYHAASTMLRVLSLLQNKYGRWLLGSTLLQ